MQPTNCNNYNLTSVLSHKAFAVNAMTICTLKNLYYLVLFT